MQDLAVATNLKALTPSDKIRLLRLKQEEIKIEWERRRRAEIAETGQIVRIENKHKAFVAAYPLQQFIRETFPVIEQGREFRDNWHISAICELLQAVILGDVRNFIINEPRRTMKSLLVCVMFPCWVWTFLPFLRFLFTSYTEKFAKRDNRACLRLIKSNYYQRRFGHLFALTSERADMIENTVGGFRQIFTIGGGTGSGGDIVLCLWYNTLITTDKGLLKIGEIVERKLDVKILTFNHETDNYEWERIAKYEKSEGRKSVEIEFSNDKSVRCTFDHPFFINGKGYVKACDLQSNDEIITDDKKLRHLRKRNQPTAEPFRSGKIGHFLFSCVFFDWAVRREQYDVESGKSVFAVCDLQQTSSPPTCTFGAKCTHILFSDLFFSWANWREKLSMGWRESQTKLRCLQERLLAKQGRSQQTESRNVFKLLPGCFRDQTEFLKRKYDSVRQLWRFISEAQHFHWQSEFLLAGMRESWASRSFEGREQRQIHSRQIGRSLPERIFEISTGDSKTRRLSLSNLWSFGRRKWQSIGRASHRLRQREQRLDELNISLQNPSRSNAWIERKSGNFEKVFVESVTPTGIPEFVYNIQIPKNHNYFANGVLAHNCDDPNNIKEAESDLVLDKTNTDWDEVSYHNVTDRDTAVRGIIQQRSAPNDLTGHILEDDDLKKLYQILTLPMRYESDHPYKNSAETPLRLGLVSEHEKTVNSNLVIGEPKLWIDPRGLDAPGFDNIWYQEWYRENFTDKGLTSKGNGQLLWENYITEEIIQQEIAHLKVYGEAGQLQQRPYRRGGNFFNSEHFEVINASALDLNGLVFGRYWDKSGTVGGGDWTVGLLMARTKKRPFRFWIIDIIRKQIGYYERMQLMVDTAKQDVADYVTPFDDNEYTVIIEREPASSGKDLVTIEKDALVGYDVFIDNVRKDKGTRAKPVRNFSEGGKIKVIKAPWNVPFFRELEKFDPKKKNQVNDQIDGMSGDFRYLCFGGDSLSGGSVEGSY